MATQSEADVVVLTALPVEYAAFRTHLRDVKRASDDAGTQYELGVIHGGTCRVALAEIGEGNDGAAVLSGHAIARFRPYAMFFVGVAGALHDDIDLGDVVVATRVYGFHGGKDDDDGFLTRPRVFDADNELLQRARFVARSVQGFRVHLGPVAAGEIVLNSRRTQLLQQLKRNYNDAIAIEMESAGMARAGHVSRVPVLTIRGISDHADGTKAMTDANSSQRIAARHAAQISAALVADLPIAPRTPAIPGIPPAAYYLALIASTGLSLPISHALVVPLLDLSDGIANDQASRRFLAAVKVASNGMNGTGVEGGPPQMRSPQDPYGVPSSLDVEAWLQLWNELAILVQTIASAKTLNSGKSSFPRLDEAA
jgi:5'-methylthioadenosine/S-adenosylhomocysteine nucleosidase